MLWEGAGGDGVGGEGAEEDERNPG
jgi:hypothetical protein